jgi:hypothetical protein
MLSVLKIISNYRELQNKEGEVEEGIGNSSIDSVNSVSRSEYQYTAWMGNSMRGT